MPYVVTTKPGCSCDCCPDTRACCDSLTVSRRAVATLDEARADVRSIALDHDSIGGAQAAMRLPEAGGTIGPLPDGTVIEVERKTWDELDALAPQSGARGTLDVIESFNARHA